MTTKNRSIRVTRAESAVRKAQARRDRAWRDVKQALDAFETSVAALQSTHDRLGRALDDACFDTETRSA